MVQIGNDWDEILADEFEKGYYKNLRYFLQKEYESRTIYPDKHDIFNAFKYTAYKDVRVVILGQDPYHGPGQAHGLSFSVRPGIPQPKSLINIFKELEDDLGIPTPDSNNGCLIPWAESGVFLLNTTLTVRAHEANSHHGHGWDQFTDRVIELLGEREDPMVFILWGKHAAAKAPLITNPNHKILTGPHPSPLSAYRGFFGGKYFSKANDFLVSKGAEPVDWRIVR